MTKIIITLDGTNVFFTLYNTRPELCRDGIILVNELFIQQITSRVRINILLSFQLQIFELYTDFNGFNFLDFLFFFLISKVKDVEDVNDILLIRISISRVKNDYAKSLFSSMELNRVYSEYFNFCFLSLGLFSCNKINQQ